MCIFCEVEGARDDVYLAPVAGREIGVEQLLESRLYHLFFPPFLLFCRKMFFSGVCHGISTLFPTSIEARKTCYYLLEPDLPDDLPTFVPPFFTAGFAAAGFAGVAGLFVVAAGLAATGLVAAGFVAVAAGLVVWLLVVAGFVVPVCFVFAALLVACLPVEASGLVAVFVVALLLAVVLFGVLLFTSGFDVVLVSVLVVVFVGCLKVLCLLVAIFLLLGVPALFVVVCLGVYVFLRVVGLVVVVSAFLGASTFFVASGFFAVDCLGVSVFVVVLCLLVFVHLEDLVSCLGVVEVACLVVLTFLGCSAALGAAECVLAFGVVAGFSSFFIAVVALLVRSLLMRAPVSVVVVLVLPACEDEVGATLREVLLEVLWRLLYRELFE